MTFKGEKKVFFFKKKEKKKKHSGTSINVSLLSKQMIKLTSVTQKCFIEAFECIEKCAIFHNLFTDIVKIISSIFC